jgi:Mlc titration factor MtfA (ptsG expression regulator)
LPWIEAMPFYAPLSGDEQRQLRDDTRVIVAEKNWEGCGGLDINDEIRVTIAAQAALLLLHIEHEYYRSALSILVYPTVFEAPMRSAGPGGMVQEGSSTVIGLAFHRGPVVLAWDCARHGAENWQDGRNVVIHEFAHKLDMLDSYADGTPPLESREHHATWLRIMTEEYERLVEKTEKRRRTVMDKYGATHPAEFFAVATETFFEKPRQLKKKRPELYELLRSYYRQDPVSRL